MTPTLPALASHHDLVVFDPKVMVDKATFDNANQPAVGFQTVIINGMVTVRDGKLVLEAAGGQPTRRPIAE